MLLTEEVVRESDKHPKCRPESCPLVKEWPDCPHDEAAKGVCETEGIMCPK
jgi:hypothetical protein